MILIIKAILNVMPSCCGNTNTICGNTTKTMWHHVFADFIGNYLNYQQKQPWKVLKHLIELIKEKRKDFR
jgi:hypothetical protein